MVSRLRILLCGASVALAAPAWAHHGPPHDEIDEFDEAPRLIVPPAVPVRPFSPLAALAAVAGTSVALLLARRHVFPQAEPARAAR